jgi:hypothetical protein
MGGMGSAQPIAPVAATTRAAVALAKRGARGFGVKEDDM